MNESTLSTSNKNRLKNNNSKFLILNSQFKKYLSRIDLNIFYDYGFVRNKYIDETDETAKLVVTGITSDTARVCIKLELPESGINTLAPSSTYTASWTTAFVKPPPNLLKVAILEIKSVGNNTVLFICSPNDNIDGSNCRVSISIPLIETSVDPGDTYPT